MAKSFSNNSLEMRSERAKNSAVNSATKKMDLSCKMCQDPETYDTRSKLYYHYSLHHYRDQLLNVVSVGKDVATCLNCKKEFNHINKAIIHAGTVHGLTDTFLPIQYRVPESSNKKKLVSEIEISGAESTVEVKIDVEKEKEKTVDQTTDQSQHSDPDHKSSDQESEPGNNNDVDLTPSTVSFDEIIEQMETEAGARRENDESNENVTEEAKDERNENEAEEANPAGPIEEEGNNLYSSIDLRSVLDSDEDD